MAAVEFSPTEHIFSFFSGFVIDAPEAEISGGNSIYRIRDYREGMGLEAQFIILEQHEPDGTLKHRAIIDRNGANHFMDPATASLTNSELELLHQPHERARYALEISASFLADTRRTAA